MGKNLDLVWEPTSAFFVSVLNFSFESLSGKILNKVANKISEVFQSKLFSFIQALMLCAFTN